MHIFLQTMRVSYLCNQFFMESPPKKNTTEENYWPCIGSRGIKELVVEAIW